MSGRPATRLTVPGSMLLALAAVGAALGRLELTALAIVVLGLDVIVARRRLASLQLSATTVREVLAGDAVEVTVRAQGTIGPVTVVLHALRAGTTGPIIPSGDPHVIDRDGTGGLPYRWHHRGLYGSVVAVLVGSGWASTVATTQVRALPLAAPVAVHPRTVRVAVPALTGEPAADARVEAARRRGTETQEVRSVRPYVPGDPKRRVHWPTTARQGQLSVVEVDAEVQEAVHLVLVLPGVPCGLAHESTHVDHVDVLTGQARFTGETLLERGVPVVLSTVEVGDDGRPHTVTAPIRGSAELGRRLAAACAGKPQVPAGTVAWYLGPDTGPARRSVVDDATGSRSERNAEPAGSGVCPGSGRATLESEPPRRRDQLRGLVDRVRFAGLVAVAAALLVVLLSVPRGVASATVAAAGWWSSAVVLAIVACVAIALRPMNRRDLTLLAVLMAFGLSALWLTATVRPLSAMVGAVVLVAWLLPRAVAVDLLVREGEEYVTWSLPRAIVLLGVAGAATAVGGAVVVAGAPPVLGALSVLAAFVVGVAWSARPTWWAGSIGCTAAAMVVIVVFVPVRAVVWLAVASFAVLLVVVEEGSRELATLDRSPPRWSLASVAIRVIVIVVAAALVTPMVGRVHDAAERWGTANDVLPLGGSGAALVARSDLDLTRPRADGRRVVLTVVSDRPLLLRTQTFDRWDGRWWSRDHDDPGSSVTMVDAVPGSQGGRASSGEVAVTQRITVHARHAELLPAAAEPVAVDAGARIVDHRDGSRRVLGDLDAGDSYTVTSHAPLTPSSELSGADDASLPGTIRAIYTREPELSRRTVAGIEDAARAHHGPYAQARAVEAWLGEQVTYSLDAPLPPPGVDVVDHFLFESRQGWCQQIATTMVLAMRHLGVPARVATGFVAHEWDGRRYVVREEHAHAWAEIHLPGVGWYAIDPSVPLADMDQGTAEEPRALPDVLLPTAVALVVAVALGALGTVLVRRRRANQRLPVTTDPRPWATATAASMRKLVRRCAGTDDGAVRGVAADAERLAVLLGDDRLRWVGRTIERDAYGPVEVDPAERAEVERHLAVVERAVEEREAHRRDAGPRAWSAASPSGGGP